MPSHPAPSLSDAPRPPRRRVAASTVMVAAVLGLSAPIFGACSDTDTIQSSREVPTAVIVDPAEFLGELPCADLEGAPRSFRATLVDLDSDPPMKSVGPSTRASCGAQVYFDQIELEHRYMANIEVYDVRADETAGSPAWFTTCAADGAGAAVPELNRHVTVRGCIPLTGPGSATTSVEVDPSSALGSLACEADGGTIGDLEVTPIEPVDSGLPTVTLACGASPVTYGAGVTAGTVYRFRVTAGDAYATTCTAVARPGLVVPASCEALTDVGAATFPIDALVESAGLTCGTDVVRARVALAAGPTLIDPRVVPCSAPATVSGILPGSYVGSVALEAGGNVIQSFACTGQVAPASTTELVCTPED